MSLRALWYLLCWTPGLLLAAAQSASESRSGTLQPHIQLTLVAEHQAWDSDTPTQWVGLYLEPEQDWHTYWQNPGDSGEAPAIDWQLPEGISAGDIQWPLPQTIPVAHLTNYGYEGAHLLMVPIEISDNAHFPIALKADISYLVCQEDCIPGWATLTLNIPGSAENIPSSSAALFEQARKQLPLAEVLQARHWQAGNTLQLALPNPTKRQANWHLFPLRGDVIDHSAPQQVVAKQNTLTFSTKVSDYLPNTLPKAEFLLSNGEQGWYVQSVLGAPSQSPEGVSSESLLLTLMMAFLGGLILNLMPCVLPVLCLKAMSFVNGINNSIGTKLGYGIGVLVSFWGFAALIALLKSSGEALGWGFHLQNPLVVALLTYLFFVIGLMLLDILPAGGRLAGVGQRLTQGQGLTPSFFTGVLAVIVASPCTAPFMAAALGVAMVSDSMTAFLIFTALALGFALPLTLVAILPVLSSFLPQPGAWMAQVKHLLAFPMFATCVWLVWIYQSQAGGDHQAVLLLGMLALAMMGYGLRLVSRLARYGLITLGLALAALPLLRPAPSLTEAATLAKADTFSEGKLAQLLADDKVVFVNITADWCISCKVNEAVALKSREVQAYLQQQNVAYLVGDWTNKNAPLLAYLNSFQRSGVPLYVVYGPGGYSQILPQILTPQIIINALNRAQQRADADTDTDY
ncbi:protein-disulfide reductase DsbD family protein [Aliiglaciecola sp. CAU 1673]|uniref:protein-disulfide reductase DsbD family protein n=1 Tax=Aliiglaciecola sp. CAU 1673 TaxID=3032595 RepID=UPI0023D9A956|nr:protein-disulfide reductase DsbD domain-containing protein [Aliiglaciecola sp. CAU 1673]MDF2177263.1 protein-disulfide reductase DsbD family protein [Aliiglaciecola sp. CAU 1673]